MLITIAMSFQLLQTVQASLTTQRSSEYEHFFNAYRSSVPQSILRVLNKKKSTAKEQNMIRKRIVQLQKLDNTVSEIIRLQNIPKTIFPPKELEELEELQKVTPDPQSYNEKQLADFYKLQERIHDVLDNPKVQAFFESHFPQPLNPAHTMYKTGAAASLQNTINKEIIYNPDVTKQNVHAFMTTVSLLISNYKQDMHADDCFVMLTRSYLRLLHKLTELESTTINLDRSVKLHPHKMKGYMRNAEQYYPELYKKICGSDKEIQEKSTHATSAASNTCIDKEFDIFARATTESEEDTEQKRSVASDASFATLPLSSRALKSPTPDSSSSASGASSSSSSSTESDSEYVAFSGISKDILNEDNVLSDRCKPLLKDTVLVEDYNPIHYTKDSIPLNVSSESPTSDEEQGVEVIPSDEENDTVDFTPSSTDAERLASSDPLPESTNEAVPAPTPVTREIRSASVPDNLQPTPSKSASWFPFSLSFSRNS